MFQCVVVVGVTFGIGQNIESGLCFALLLACLDGEGSNYEFGDSIFLAAPRVVGCVTIVITFTAN